MRIALGVCIFTCLAVAGFGARLALEQQRRLASLSATTTATIVAKRLERHERPLRERHRQRPRRNVHDWFRYEPVVTYRYTVRGRNYSGDRVFPETFRAGGNLGYMAAKAPLDRFHVGQATTAYHDRSAPADACLIRRPALSAYFTLLLPVVVLSALVWFGWRAPLSPTRPRERRRRASKALGIAVLWHTVGLAAAAHYLWLAGPDAGRFAVTLFALYAQIGLIPLAAAMPPADTSLLVRRVKGAIGFSLFGTFAGLLFGALLAWGAATFFSATASAFFRCWGYTTVITAVLFAALGSIAEWRVGEAPGSASSA